MSEIEKMYENAEVNKVGKRSCTDGEYANCQNYCFVTKNNKCDKFNYQYPPFTAEKQIELIKWLGLKDDIDYIRYYYKPLAEEWVFEITYMTEFSNEPAFIVISYEHKLEEGLAKCINNLWQSLTEEERKQIKNILQEVE